MIRFWLTIVFTDGFGRFGITCLVFSDSRKAIIGQWLTSLKDSNSATKLFWRCIAQENGRIIILHVKKMRKMSTAFLRRKLPFICQHHPQCALSFIHVSYSVSSYNCWLLLWLMNATVSIIWRWKFGNLDLNRPLYSCALIVSWP